MIILDGSQSVYDVCEGLDLPDGTLVEIHLEYGRCLHCELEDAKYCYIVYRMYTQYDGDDLILHLYNY